MFYKIVGNIAAYLQLRNVVNNYWVIRIVPQTSICCEAIVENSDANVSSATCEYTADTTIILCCCLVLIFCLYKWYLSRTSIYYIIFIHTCLNIVLFEKCIRKREN